MTPNSHSSFAYAWLAVLASVSTAGCLCPPCPGTVAAGPAAAAAPGGGNAAQAAPAGPVATGSRLVLWDGDNAGSGAQGWESCDKQPNCKVKVGPVPDSGMNKSTGLNLHGEGPGSILMGWNLFGWYPENAGYDMTPYSHLTFQIRVEAKSVDAAPDPASVGVLLGCSRNKKDSATVSVEKYAKGFQDGKWHKVEIPVSAFTKGGGAAFDIQSLWEFRLATWSATNRNFDIYLDDIALEKQ
jgi:hypothetical protein